MSQYLGHTTEVKEKAEVGGTLLVITPGCLAYPALRVRGPGELTRPTGPEQQGHEGALGPARGCWHRQLLWLPSADLVAVQRAIARRAGQVGTRHRLASRVEGLHWEVGPVRAKVGFQLPKGQSVFQRKTLLLRSVGKRHRPAGHENNHSSANTSVVPCLPCPTPKEVSPLTTTSLFSSPAAWPAGRLLPDALSSSLRGPPTPRADDARRGPSGPSAPPPSCLRGSAGPPNTSSLFWPDGSRVPHARPQEPHPLPQSHQFAA